MIFSIVFLSFILSAHFSQFLISRGRVKGWGKSFQFLHSSVILGGVQGIDSNSGVQGCFMAEKLTRSPALLISQPPPMLCYVCLRSNMAAAEDSGASRQRT